MFVIGGGSAPGVDFSGGGGGGTPTFIDSAFVFFLNGGVGGGKGDGLCASSGASFDSDGGTTFASFSRAFFVDDDGGDGGVGRTTAFAFTLLESILGFVTFRFGVALLSAAMSRLTWFII